jgi:Recombination endonuclease VII
MPMKDQAAYRRKRRAEGKDLQRGKPNPEKARAAVARYALRHPERVRRAQRRRHQNKPYRKNGFTPELYNQLYASQGGRCALCGKPQIEGRRLAGDHDHQTGQPRELLCNRCNPALGLFNDDPVVLIRAALYVLKHKP